MSDASTTSRHRRRRHEPTGTSAVDVDDPRLTRFDLVREGARRDGIEIVHYEPQFPVPGTRPSGGIERTIALLFLLAGLLAHGLRGRLHLVAVASTSRATTLEQATTRRCSA